MRLCVRRPLAPPSDHLRPAPGCTGRCPPAHLLSVYPPVPTPIPLTRSPPPPPHPFSSSSSASFPSSSSPLSPFLLLLSSPLLSARPPTDPNPRRLRRLRHLAARVGRYRPRHHPARLAPRGQPELRRQAPAARVADAGSHVCRRRRSVRCRCRRLGGGCGAVDTGCGRRRLVLGIDGGQPTYRTGPGGSAAGGLPLILCSGGCWRRRSGQRQEQRPRRVARRGPISGLHRSQQQQRATHGRQPQPLWARGWRGGHNDRQSARRSERRRQRRGRWGRGRAPRQRVQRWRRRGAPPIHRPIGSTRPSWDKRGRGAPPIHRPIGSTRPSWDKRGRGAPPIHRPVEAHEGPGTIAGNWEAHTFPASMAVWARCAAVEPTKRRGVLQAVLHSADGALSLPTLSCAE